jgi:hypothetical protein
MEGFVGAGKILMRRLDIVAAQFLEVGNSPSLSVNIPTEIKKRASRMPANYGATLDSVAIAQDAALSMTLDDLRMDNLALALLGQKVALTQAAVATQSYEISAAVKGAWYDVGHLAISNVVVSTGSTTYEAGTDYEIDAEAGMIHILEGGSIAADSTVTVAYDAGDVAGAYIDGNTQPTALVQLRLLGKNLVDGSKVLFDAWRVTLSPNAAIDWLAPDFGTLQFNGSLEVPSDKTSPFRVQNF